ncbi:50S ribosomal protein L23 [Candidatus Roizmanbacteria bacterium RIFCSPHIGHO2_02_FULL_37_15]|uniref:Large ribosomal subunit protein uL23 n=1 Tax=Candidatus Roizmanbacteria bacterium RIFCSPLOWO2_01_FULL_37_16 TaxID=1802058 RepID=A0A1F7IPC0_9BACT|nr:MAG: 50S ribosomal protein L23 [Candidatus Roizmanbacteria bacterium RIFCSPHIGHO2_01_FULL_37_16b]OGK21772.1 MAG: 50S ribosomal protein L23 [Candidatus Roizmanbacteria bacterium RIFCSPHIGHO2_02_FULL_37_15]OGK33713.1 MAG: 50S ribosomal protein L23 [Candidatus Roizmanbacteria bacterium RIFCSPHIGHO2_12_FULL_36_11]OGK45217.1 MAG: 50S ribosomal protein L23 [Candidatus Roizmanbacteria bacterium RIFCSPLOWO2_01_FULL_37_16]OGK57574.1 MAG: 50S ribosomal protein L23 [Candidatus Roizmanbacteria bacterium
MKINNILIRPVVTEKATNLIGNKVYTFETNLRADKHKIKEALEKLYKVKVKKVRIMIRVGKKRKVGKRMVVKKLANKKIALIELSEGKIELFPQA